MRGLSLSLLSLFKESLFSPTFIDSVPGIRHVGLHSLSVSDCGVHNYFQKHAPRGFWEDGSLHVSVMPSFLFTIQHRFQVT